MNVLPPQPQPIHRTGAEILQQHIRLRNQVPRHRKTFRRFQINTNRPLIPIKIRKKPRRETTQFARPIALRRLHMNDIGAEIG